MIYYVYFVQAGTDGPIKIGVTWNIPNRLYALQQASPDELRRIGDIHCKNSKAARALEHNLHQQLKNAHIRGEWFKPTAEVYAAVPPACSSNTACSATLLTGLNTRSPFSTPPGVRPLNFEGEYPPWADSIDRHNLSMLPMHDRQRMVASARRWCGSGR